MHPPSFRYHYNPYQISQVFAERSALCFCCGEMREYTYTGPIHQEAGLVGALCPWCIRGGLAHLKFGVEFTKKEALERENLRQGGHAPRGVLEEIAYCTPGVPGPPQERWLFHCGDAYEFVETGCRAMAESWYFPGFIESQREDVWMSEEEFDKHFDDFDEHGLIAYMFKCLQCERY